MKIVGTNITNLIRDGDTGIYYARVKIRQKIFLRSLGEDCTTKEKAKLRIADKVEEIRESLEPRRPASRLDPNATVGDAVEFYRVQVAKDDIKESSKEFRLRPASRAKVNWPDFYDRPLKSVHFDELEAMIADLKAGKFPYAPPNSKGKTLPGDSPTVVNAMIGLLRRIFDIGVSAGVVSRNPARQLKKKRIPKKVLNLPSRDGFQQLVQFVRLNAARGRITGDLIEGLAYSGMRVDESRRMLWRHLDFGRGMMTVFGTKSPDSARHIPMTPDFQKLVLGMKSTRGEVQPDDPVFKARSASGCLVKGCEHIGHEPYLTHHDLRDLFATTVIESGVDVPTLSQWLGHADGGALAMKIYGHIRPQHAAEAAKKVSFK